MSNIISKIKINDVPYDLQDERIPTLEGISFIFRGTGVTDANNATDMGLYFYAKGAANIPSTISATTTGFLLVFKGSTRILQLATCSTVSTTSVFMRKSTGSTWGSWYKVSFTAA